MVRDCRRLTGRAHCAGRQFVIRPSRSFELDATAPGEGAFSVTALDAIGRVPEDATAFAGRASAFDLSEAGMPALHISANGTGAATEGGYR